MMNNKWLQWATELQSVAQAGLAFCENDYDRDRYEKIRDITIDILHEYTDLDHTKVRELFASEKGYQTPKVDVRAVVFRDDSILLIKEKVDGAWALPGGWADVNTSVSESAVRESFEEAGAIVKPLRIIAIHLASKHNNPVYPFTIYKIFVQCELVEYKFRDNTETDDSGFFTIESLPALSTDRTTKKQIEMCFEAKKHEVFQTIFD
jgi:ADP-ribose pyrophosphatase YjhB (NUDIX family)